MSKKLPFLVLVLIVTTISFVSCSDDNDNSNQGVQNQDVIVGTWTFSRAVDYYNNTEHEFLATNCERNGKQVFNADGSYDFEVYSEENSNCEKFMFSSSGTWSRSNNSYLINYELHCLGIDCEPGVAKVILVDENTLRIRYDGDTVNGQVVEYYFREYIK